MHIINLIIVDRKTENIAAVKSCFDGDPHVTWMVGDIRTVSNYDCLITPGNSFGIMDGGFDLVVVDLFGNDIEKKIQNRIYEEFYGELPVGCAVSAGNQAGPVIIYAPTMRVPMQITRTDNVYCAMRAALIWIKKWNDSGWDFNKTDGLQPLKTIVTPLLGSGAGKVPPKEAAMQMKLALDSMQETRQPITNWHDADALQKRIGLGYGGDPDNY